MEGNCTKKKLHNVPIDMNVAPWCERSNLQNPPARGERWVIRSIERNQNQLEILSLAKNDTDSLLHLWVLGVCCLFFSPSQQGSIVFLQRNMQPFVNPCVTLGMVLEDGEDWQMWEGPVVYNTELLPPATQHWVPIVWMTWEFCLEGMQWHYDLEESLTPYSNAKLSSTYLCNSKHLWCTALALACS